MLKASYFIKSFNYIFYLCIDQFLPLLAMPYSLKEYCRCVSSNNRRLQLPSIPFRPSQSISMGCECTQHYWDWKDCKKLNNTHGVRRGPPISEQYLCFELILWESVLWTYQCRWLIYYMLLFKLGHMFDSIESCNRILTHYYWASFLEIVLI